MFCFLYDKNFSPRWFLTFVACQLSRDPPVRNFLIGDLVGCRGRETTRKCDLSEISHHVKWSLRKEVRIALLKNDKTPLARVLAFAQSMSAPVLREVLATSRLSEKVKEYLSNAKVTDLGDEMLDELQLEGSPDSYRGRKLDYLARRPDCSAEKLIGIVTAAIGETKRKEIVVALNDIRYSGYLKDQQTLARKRGRYEDLEIPRGVDFSSISGLSNEVVQKLGNVQPRTIGQAARIPGITPAAVSILLVEMLRN